MKIESGKYYRTRNGRKVGPIGYNPNITNYGKFFSGETFWDEFGRLYQATKENDLDLIAEWTEDETGTLAELDVKPGDVVELIGGSKTQYTIDRIHKEKVFGDKTSVNLSNDGCGNGWKLISRASDTPKTWGEMTNAEKGELLLARYEGKVIELHIPITDETGEVLRHEWVSYQGEIGSKYAYRIKPEPVRETVTLYGVNGYQGDIEFDSGRDFGDWRITFTTTDGNPDLDSIKMEEV